MAQNVGHIDDEIIILDEQGKLQKVAGTNIEDFEKEATKHEPEQLGIFSPEEQSEINGLKQQIPLGQTNGIDYEKIVTRIVKSAKVTFPKEQVDKQFRNVLLTCLKDVRDLIETKSTLLRPQRLSGLGLKIGKADQIINILKDEIKKLKEGAESEIELSDEKEMKQQTEEKIQFTQKPKLVYSSQPQYQNSDLEYKTKLIGPIEELRQLTIVDFRRLAKNPREATDKIFDKVKILREDSFVDGIKAVKAWQTSSLNQLYLSLGRQSINDSQNLENIIDLRIANNEDYLTINEFKAIMDFNKKLRN
ncbi:hypothetical protein KKA15_01695 [Patescibacteria group bacterium]|nr:hypothetical protein [Patescibacteria group bacterium]